MRRAFYFDMALVEHDILSPRTTAQSQLAEGPTPEPDHPLWIWVSENGTDKLMTPLEHKAFIDRQQENSRTQATLWESLNRSEDQAQEEEGEDIWEDHSNTALISKCTGECVTSDKKRRDEVLSYDSGTRTYTCPEKHKNQYPTPGPTIPWDYGFIANRSSLPLYQAAGSRKLRANPSEHVHNPSVLTTIATTAHSEVDPYAWRFAESLQTMREDERRDMKQAVPSAPSSSMRARFSAPEGHVAQNTAFDSAAEADAVDSPASTVIPTIEAGTPSDAIAALAAAPNTETDAFNTATPASVNIPQGLTITAKELLYYFPYQSYLVSKACYRLFSNGFTNKDMAAIQHRARGGGQTIKTENRIKGQFKHAGNEVQNVTDFTVTGYRKDGMLPNVSDYSTIHWRARTGMVMRDIELARLADGLVSLPSGRDAGTLTAAVRYAVSNRQERRLLSDVAALIRERNWQMTAGWGTSGFNEDVDFLRRERAAHPR
ncbi:hypothetical protein LTR66_000729 [Elasticomyces elasticus]|nr:hypothetical protein LTR66_000729 [Elasticomyces elasticus]